MAQNHGLREIAITRATTVVIKVGTNVLTNSSGHLDGERIRLLAEQIQHIRDSGRNVVLVSSGAIGAGVGKLGLGKRPADLPHLQACAAVGQIALMQLYQEHLAKHGTLAAQILVTAGDFDNRVRYLNVRNTIRTLWEYRVLPIINENDTVSVAEIKFGDNDHLAAMVANLLRSPLLILLTNVDGLFSADPTTNPGAELLATVPHIDRDVTNLASSSKSVLGAGGMRSKLRAARLATAAGGTVIMANGAVPGILDRIFSGEEVGTLFQPHGENLPSWKRWVGFTVRPSGKLLVDAGAARAVVTQGRSLLAIGVKAVEGEFRKGDIVSVCDSTGKELARGLTNYSAVDTSRIIGLSTEQISAILGSLPYEELIHRDNLMVTDYD